MILVFGSFMFGGARELAEFGFGLAFSVLVDALLIRSLLVPALMHLVGRANWALPRPLDRLLPRLAIEGAEVAPDQTAGGDADCRALASRRPTGRPRPHRAESRDPPLVPRAEAPLAIPGHAIASGGLSPDHHSGATRWRLS